jgi:putative glutamine amidotransferase
MANHALIGITTCLENSPYVYVRRAYPAAVEHAGGRPVLVTPELPAEVVRDICAGLLITGGGDLPRSFFPADLSISAHTGGEALESPERVDWERTLLDLFGRAGKPVLGICYGMQLMNLHFGGTLYRDIKNDIGNVLDHSNGGAHRIRVTFSSESSLFPVLGKNADVLCRHHQAIDRISQHFFVAARSSDGLIEAIEREHMLGIEWHAEADATAAAVYGWLVNAAKRSQNSVL